MTTDTKPTGVSDTITNDLMQKVADDVVSAILRVLSIAPEMIPVATTAAAASVGILAARLYCDEDGEIPAEPPASPDADCILLAGLIAARVGIGGDDPIGQAYRDFATLTSKDTGND